MTFFWVIFLHVWGLVAGEKGHDLGPQGVGIPSGYYLGNYQRLT